MGYSSTLTFKNKDYLFDEEYATIYSIQFSTMYQIYKNLMEVSSK